MINSALEYVEKYGFSIIPMKYLPPQNGEAKGKKIPRLPEWKRYQKEKPSIEQVKLWWENWPDAMIGVITGKLSGVCRKICFVMVELIMFLDLVFLVIFALAMCSVGCMLF